MNISLTSLLLILISIEAYSQSQNELGEKSLNYFNSGKQELAIGLLERSREESSLSIDNFKLLAKFYDAKGFRSKVFETLIYAITKYPSEGSLYYETGKIKFIEHDYAAALSYWEDGILSDPGYADNYFEAARLLGFTDEIIWSVIYAEIFLNLETDSKKRADAARLMFDAYNKAINIVSDSVVSLSFSQSAYFRTGEFKITSFESFFENAYLYSLSGFGDTLTLKTLIETRILFVENWYRAAPVEYDNILFDYNKQLLKKNFLRPYNYYLFADVYEKEFSDWYKENSDTYNEFLNWIKLNPLSLNSYNKFNRFIFN